MKISLLLKNGFFRPWFLVIPLLFPSCVTTKKDLLYLNRKIAAVNERVDSLQGSMEKKVSGDLESKLKSIRYNQAEMGAELDKIRAETERLSGRLEENSHLVKGAVERDTTGEDATKATLNELKERVSALEMSINHLYEYLDIAPAPEIASQTLKDTTVAKESQQEPLTSEERKRPISPEKESYSSTRAIYKEGKYEAALAGFKSFVKKYPKSDLADNAQFWIGECYLSLKQYEHAILAYQEVIKKYPKGNKVPNAMLRQALAFYEIKDKTSSRLLLKKIIKEYPHSSEAKIARAKLKALK